MKSPFRPPAPNGDLLTAAVGDRYTKGNQRIRNLTEYDWEDPMHEALFAARRTIARLAVVLSVLLGPLHAPSLLAQPQANPSLLSVELLPKVDGAVARITANGPLDYRILGNGAPTSRLVIDFPNTRNTLQHYFPEEKHPLVNRILMYEFEDKNRAPRGRVVFDLQREAFYRTKSSPSAQLIIDLTNGNLVPGADSKESPLGRNPVLAAPVFHDDAPIIDDAPETVDTNLDPPRDPAVPDNVQIVPASVDTMLFFGNTSEEEHPLGAEDVLEIHVFELEQLNRTVRVAGNGSINLPLIGRVQAAGKTPDEVSQQIAAKLSDGFVQNPQVSIFVTEFNSQSVSVLGAVGTPATYSLMGPRRLLQILAEAGSLADNAGNTLFLFRQTTDGQSARLSVPLNELMVNGDPRWNVVIRPGDVLSVPPGNAVSISVLGAVNQPGVYRLPSGDDATLLTAIAQAGGLSERAAKKGAQIKRRLPSGEQSVIRVNLADILSGKQSDPVLQSGDVIVVKESFF